jgi:YVTN family beta-propeller protein
MLTSHKLPAEPRPVKICKATIDEGDRPMGARRALLLSLPFAFATCSLPVAASNVSIFVTNSAGDSIHVIDAATNKVVQVLSGIEGAHGICFAPDGSRIYVSNEADSTLDVLDRSGKVLKKIPLSDRPNNIAITSDGSRVAVAIRGGAGALDLIETASMSLIKSIPVKGALHNVYITPDDKYAVAGSIGAKTVTVFDLGVKEIAWEHQFDLGIRPIAIESSADGSAKRLFVQLSEFNGFAALDFASHEEVARIKLPDWPSGYGIQEVRGDAPSHGLGVSPDGKSLWVTSIYANAVFAYSLSDLNLLGYVALPDLKVPGREPIGAVPNWVTFTPDGGTLYISNAALRSVSAVDTKAMKLIAAIPVGEVPKRINTLAVRETH